MKYKIGSRVRVTNPYSGGNFDDGDIVTMARELGLVESRDFGLIWDACRTELKPEEENGTTLTGIWFCPLPDETAHAISKKYHLYT